MMGFYISQYTDDLLPGPKLNKASFLPMNDVTEQVLLPQGDYLVMPCLFEPKEEGPFTIQVQSQSEFKLIKLQY
jgi:hypothetical protein